MSEDPKLGTLSTLRPIYIYHITSIRTLSTLGPTYNPRPERYISPHRAPLIELKDPASNHKLKQKSSNPEAQPLKGLFL